jgi:hypothetical protein
MTQSLAVNRDNREFAVLFRILCKAVQPFEKAVLKCGRSDSGKEGANTIPTGRFSFWQIKPGFEPLLLILRPSGNRFWTFRACDDGSQRNGNNILYRVKDIDGSPRIINFPTRVSESSPMLFGDFNHGIPC